MSKKTTSQNIDKSVSCADDLLELRAITPAVLMLY
jgi:hypothetical protein